MIKVLIQHKWITLSLLFLVAAIRLFNLNADSNCFYILSGYLDQGAWLNAAKNKMLYDSWMVDEYIPGLTIAPLHSLLTYFSFKTFGISFFSSRILSATASFLTVVFCYVLCRREKGVALFTCLLLGLNVYFYSYSRIGLIEPILNLALVLIFLLLQKPTSNIRMVVVGLMLTCILLLKWVAIYFYPTIGLYLIFLLVRKEIELKQIGILASVAVMSLLLVGYFYYSNYWGLFSKTMLTLWEDTTIKESGIVEKIIYFFSTQMFAHPSVFALVLLCIMYSYTSKFWQVFERPIHYIRTLSKIELVAICWVLGYGFTLLFTGFNERRFIVLSIPMAMLGAYALLGKNKVIYPSKIKWSVILLLFFIVNGAVVILQYVSNITDLSLTLIGSSLFILGLFLVQFVSSERYVKAFYDFGIFSLIFCCFSGFLFFSFDSISLAYDIQVSKISRYSIAVFGSGILLFLIIHQTKRIKEIIMVLYIICGVWAIIYQQSTLTYNYYTHNLVVRKMLAPKEYITGDPHLFTVYNAVIPIRINPETELNVNKSDACNFAISCTWLTNYEVNKNSALSLSDDYTLLGKYPLGELNGRPRVEIKYFKKKVKQINPALKSSIN
jgi:4-amino-4-deoxy-L-arabinose transferase-like glycosyltransferase